MADPSSFGNPERDIEQAFLALKRGTQLVKYSRKGKPKFCTFRLSQDETTLIWISRGKEKNLNLSAVLRIIPGQRTAVFRRYLRPEKDSLSFSLIYKKGDRSLDLICKDNAEVELWFSCLKTLISPRQHTKRHTRSDLSDDSVDIAPNDRPFGGALEFTSSISRSRFSFESVPRESTSSKDRSDVGSDYACTTMRASIGDGSRISVSSAGYSSSIGSGPDDIESLGDVFIWGEVWADGISSDGLGTQVPSKTDVLIPKPLESNVVLDVHQIGPGVRHIALVTRQGEVFTWGEDSGGRLGHGFDKDFGRPQIVESLAITSVGFVACGEFHTCAVSTSGDLYSWGDGTHNAGILGHGTDVSHCLPKRITGILEGLQVLSIACGTWHTALVTTTGKLFTFGDGIFGALGHGDQQSVPYPKEVHLLNGQKAIKVACGMWHTAAIIEVMDQPGSSNSSSSRKLFTWGDGDQYRLGHVNKDTYLQPTCVAALADYSFQQVACGHTMTVALTASGHVFTMGSKEYGQLGNPMSDGKVPNLVRDKLVGESVEEISCGAYHVAVLTSRSEIYTWGRGANGRLGHGDTEDQKSPTMVEALRDRHVKNISCGSCFTTCICIHKWISGADQSVCSGCRQPFGFTRKRHNCHHCGLVYCHPCSSKKAQKAALAPTPSKPHRVCDTCYSKLKGSESSNVSNFNREITRPASSAYGREVRTSRNLLSPATGPMRNFDLSSRVGSTHNSSSTARDVPAHLRLHLKDVVFPGWSNAMPNASKSIQQTSHPATPPAPSTSRPTSPYGRRPPSPPRSVSPGFSRSLIDNFKKKNELLNQEVSKLQTQIRNMKQRSSMQDTKMQEFQKSIEEANLLADEESAKNREAKEFIKFMTDQLKEVTEKLPPEIPENEILREIHIRAQHFLKEIIELESSSFQSSFESEQQSEPDIPASHSNSSNLQENRPRSPNGGNVLQESESINSSVSGSGASPPSSENSSRTSEPYMPVREGEVSVIEQFEHGVYITLILLPSGIKLFKRVRFSKRRFSAQQAEEWWNQNKDKVLKKYSQAPVMNESSGSSITPPHAEENNY